MVRHVWIILLGLFFPYILSAKSLPTQPQQIHHPGSASYPFQSVRKQEISIQNRKGTLYLPGELKPKTFLPLIAFGRGHKVPEFTYRRSFEHFARKGYAVLFVPYDQGYDEEDFAGKAKQYNHFVAETVSKFSQFLNPSMVVFSGHSYGALAAIMAGGLPESEMKITPSAILSVAPSKNFPDYMKRIPSKTVCNLIVGDEDPDLDVTEQIFPDLNCEKKQLIILSSYRNFSKPLYADHGSIRTFGWGGNQETPLHWFGYWKFFIGAAEDLKSHSRGTNPWIYGKEAQRTGSDDLFNHVLSIGF